ncbi:hypothetical protein K438DRAFT_1786483, partial [Mycena galopus ATCC 62051]
LHRTFHTGPPLEYLAFASSFVATALILSSVAAFLQFEDGGLVGRALRSDRQGEWYIDLPPIDGDVQDGRTAPPQNFRGRTVSSTGRGRRLRSAQIAYLAILGRAGGSDIARMPQSQAALVVFMQRSGGRDPTPIATLRNLHLMGKGMRRYLLH